jgi:ceramide glucosyltransferase
VDFVSLLRDAVILLTVLGTAQTLLGLVLVRAFARRRSLPPATALPPVTVLKPVCGEEALLEDALISFCLQNYPRFHMVVGAQDPRDPAIATARRVRTMFPGRIDIVVDPTPHGANGKISNLINMLPYARHDLLVIADSDLHVRPDYLRQVVAALRQPGCGLVTTVAGGEAAVRGPAARLGATHISHNFLPGALLAAAMGRQDCLGGTMALTRQTLDRAGGLDALVDHLADDNLLGQLVARLGLSTRLAATLPVVTVQERSLRAVWLHELRWARTIGRLVPVRFCLSSVQYPLFWTGLAVLLTGGAAWALACFAAAWAVRAGVVLAIDASLKNLRARPAHPTPAWLLPVRDVLSVLEICCSYFGNRVLWRGRIMHAGKVTVPFVAASADGNVMDGADAARLGSRAPDLVPARLASAAQTL